MGSPQRSRGLFWGLPALNLGAAGACLYRGGFDGFALVGLAAEAGLLAGLLGRGALRRFGRGLLVFLVVGQAVLVASPFGPSSPLDGLYDVYVDMGRSLPRELSRDLPLWARALWNGFPAQGLEVVFGELLLGLPAVVFALAGGLLAAVWPLVFVDPRVRRARDRARSRPPHPLTGTPGTTPP